MNKDLTVNIARDISYYEELLVRVEGQLVWIYKQNILDEDGNYLSWYFHPVFKKLKVLYYDSKKQAFWLPKEKLYNKVALKSRLKNSNYAFFKYDYARALLEGTETRNKSKMTGFLQEGETL